MNHAPYRIETDRLLLRPYDPGDAAWFKEMVDESEEILSPFLWWYTGRTLDETVERLREFRADFDRGTAFPYAVFEGERPVAGGILHTRCGAFGLEVGYWVRQAELGRGLATETAAALVHVAFAACGADRVELHIAPDNTASVAVAERLGIPLEATLRRRWADRDGNPCFDLAVYTRFRRDYDATPALRAYDALGRQLV